MTYAEGLGAGYDDRPVAGVAEVAIVDVAAAMRGRLDGTADDTVNDTVNDTADGALAVADELVAAFRRTGFAVVVGHQVPAEVFEEMTAVSREFFALSIEEKLAVVMPSPEVIRGYEPPPEFAPGGARTPNVMECLLINRLDELADYAPGSPQARLWRWPNLWPERPQELRPIWERYYQEMDRLGMRLLELVALGIGLPGDWFVDKFDRHFNNLASNFYPPRDVQADNGSLPNRPHTDHGALTLLYRPSEPGGLEVYAEQHWWRVPFVPGSVVLNIGDILERWTGGLLRATPHRVVVASGEAAALGRQSIAFFQQPNPDALVAPAEPFRELDSAARFTDITAGLLVSRKELGAEKLASLGLAVAAAP